MGVSFSMNKGICTNVVEQEFSEVDMAKGPKLTPWSLVCLAVCV